jgi:hypothetical protein
MSFDLKFPIKWSIPKSLLEDVQTVPHESEDADIKLMSFVSEMNDVEINKTITKIVKIIKLNKEREQKEILFKKTIDELKKTFEQNDLEKLQNLYFEFADEDDTSNLDTYDTGQSENTELV